MIVAGNRYPLYGDFVVIAGLGPNCRQLDKALATTSSAGELAERALIPSDPLDAAAVVELPPGAYILHVDGKGETGEAIGSVTDITRITRRWSF